MPSGFELSGGRNRAVASLAPVAPGTCRPRLKKEGCWLDSSAGNEKRL